MASKLFQQLNTQNQAPQQKNNSIQDIIAEVNGSGMTAQQLFYKKVQEKGLDANQILSQAQKMASQFRFR